MQPDSLIELAKAIEESQARVVLVGGFAMILHGVHYITQDFDLAFSSEDTDEEVGNLLLRIGAKPNYWKSQAPFVFDRRLLSLPFMHLQSDIGPIDLLFKTPPVPFEQLWTNSVRMPIDGVDLRIASLEDLITIKSQTGRDKDQIHLNLLLKLKNLKENP